MAKSEKYTAQSAQARNDLSLEQLVAQQNVVPIQDIDALSALWPAEDDPDKFASFLNSERQARRDIDKSKE